MNDKNIQELSQYNSSGDVTLLKNIDFNKVATITKSNDGVVQIKNGQDLVIWDNKYNIQEDDFDIYTNLLEYKSSEYKYDVNTPESMTYVFNLALIDRIELTNPTGSSSRLVVYYVDTSKNESIDSSQYNKLIQEWTGYSLKTN